MDKKRSIIDFYLEFCDTYRKKYGALCLVLMESGHFMEIYDYQYDSNHLRICEEVLNIIVTRRDKSDVNSPYMAGIPTHSIKRYYNILLKNNYTVVIVSQVSPPPNVKREVTQILSPGCNLSEDVSINDTSLLVSILIEIDSNNDYFVNVSTFDSNIGETELYYIESNSFFTLLRDTLEKLNYNEIMINVIIYKEIEDEEQFKKNIIDKLDIQRKLHHIIIHLDSTIKSYFRNDYQTNYLEKVFPKYKTIYNHIKENLFLDKEDPLLIVNLIFMYNFLYQHDKNLILNLNKPIIVNKDDIYLKSFNNAYLKLNIFNSNSKSLLDYINFTSTISGKKRLMNNLKHPILDKEKLLDGYDKIDELLNNKQIIFTLEENLKLMDLERIYRRFNINKLNPYDIPKIKRTNIHILNIFDIIQSFKKISSLNPDNKCIERFRQYNDELKTIFNSDACLKVNLQDISVNIFNRDVSEEIDIAYDMFEEEYSKLGHIVLVLESFLDTKKTISIKYNDKEGYWLDITTTRGLKLKHILKNNKKQLDIDILSIEFNTQNKSNIKINSNEIKRISKACCSLKEDLVRIIRKTYFEKMSYLFSTYYFDCIEKVNDCITNIDVLKSYAKCAYSYKYCRPIISEKDYSDIELKQVRHPIIERILIEEGRKYVANDIYIGPNESTLIYGVNSVGKSSLLKSVAICIIMAQSGFYVPASSCKISLYKKLFTRMGNDDNLYTNHSSFVKEMTESREIIKHADKHSFIIADELCSSTEIDSAIKIVSSIIKILSDKKSSFLFSTHFFQLSELPIINNLSNIHYKHLKVDFKDNLIFERILKDGLPDNKYYGILVANKIIQEQEFIEIIQNPDLFHNHSSQIVNTKKSKYNSHLTVSECQVCYYKPMYKYDIPLETHHLNMQCNAIDKYHGIHHQNELNNLVVLCKTCHQSTHKNKLMIEGYKDIDDGLKLNFSWFIENNKPLKRKKYSLKDIEYIKNIYKNNNKMSKKEILQLLKIEHSISISMSIFNKIISNNY